MGLDQHRNHGTAAVFAPKGGNDAIGTVIVAALRDAEIGIIPGRGQHPVKLVDIGMTGRCDGIGRRAGLKIPWWRHRAGSTPATGTKPTKSEPYPSRGWVRILLYVLKK